MNTTFFFGYGLLSDRKILSEIIGKDPGVGQPALIEGYQLAYQVLPQIPENLRPTLKKAWGDNFKAYTLRGGTGVVAGVVWELSDEDFKKIMAWEFVGAWRESLSGTAKTSDGVNVSVKLIKVPDTQPIEETVNGLRYEINLNHKYTVRNESKEQDEELLSAVRRQIKELSSQGAYGKQTFA